MAGQIRRMLDAIIEKRAKGNYTLALTTKTKLIIKGFDPEQYDRTSADDPYLIERVKVIAGELGVSI